MVQQILRALHLSVFLFLSEFLQDPYGKILRHPNIALHFVLSGMWLVIDIAVAIDEIYYPPPN